MNDLTGINVVYSLVRCRDISTGEAILLSLFSDIGLESSIPNNSDIAFCLGTSKQNISRMISRLIEVGFLESKKNMNDEEVFNTLGGYKFKKGCIFCGYNKSSLDKHHYPIRAKDNGTDTINICPNCHREFHELADYNRHIIFTKKAKDLING